MSVTPAVRKPSPFATVARIICQLKADPRTVGLILVVPALLLTLLYFVFVDVPVAPAIRLSSIRLAPSCSRSCRCC